MQYMVKEGVLRQQMKVMYEAMQVLCSHVFALLKVTTMYWNTNFCNVLV